MTYRADVDEDRNKPLREDVRLLGSLLGDTLKAREGDTLYRTVEDVRALAKAARAGDTTAFETLTAALSDMPVDSMLPLARAFAHFLNLANIAEQHHRVRRRRAHRRDLKSPPQRGSCEEAFARLIAGGLAPRQLHEAVCGLRIELVLTAHPTEVSRRTLAEKYNRIAAFLDEHDRLDLSPPEQGEIEAALEREILTAWGTSDVRRERPSVLDEVRGGLIVFEQSLWSALPRYLHEVDRALLASTGQGLPIDAVPIRFGSWIGGDRDGNPNVTPEVTRRACLLARWVAANLYLREIEALRDELSLNDASPELRAQVGDVHEPYRELLRGVRKRMAATLAWIEASLEGEVAPADDVYLDEGELEGPLRLCSESLHATRQGFIAEGRLSDLRRRVAVFGLTLARLDIRQDAARHSQALSAITTAIDAGRYEDWDEPDRLEFLQRELASRRPLVPDHLDAGDEVRDTLDTFRMIARIPAGSLGAYVITMASRASDVLAVALLQKACGVAAPLRVVPLFETSRDLTNAGAVLDTLLPLPGYRARIDGRQEVMVGYSDSAKDVGRLAAGWDLYRAQEEIVAACHRHGVEVTLFHGRGGSVGRGGGPTHLAILAQPAGSIDGTLRVTEQGEMLQSLFGLPDIALRTLEVYTSATLEAWLSPAAPPRPEWRACMDRLRDSARDRYRAIVYNDPRFVEYFHDATPEAELAEMNIGSRPARRKVAGTDAAANGDVKSKAKSSVTSHGDDSAKGAGKGGAKLGVESLRAIPWQFAWTQTRLMLGAWLGLEDALDDAYARGERDQIAEMYREWTHFRSSIDLIEMVLAKADARIAAEYERRLVPEDLRPLGAELRGRLERAVARVLDITRHRELLESNPVLRRSIDVRNPYVDPINLLQVELLHRARRDDDARVNAALLVTVNGIAAGMRNTG
jgi:phosphoenolpyruvate carboxylase